MKNSRRDVLISIKTRKCLLEISKRALKFREKILFKIKIFTKRDRPK